MRVTRITKALSALLFTSELTSFTHSFTPTSSFTTKSPSPRNNNDIILSSAPAESDFERPLLKSDRQTVDPNTYNAPLETSAELWTASVQESDNADRKAGMPYMDSKSKDYFVGDVPSLEVSRDGGLGLELLELAGGRDDGIGITIVSAVTEGGNTERAGILPGDSTAAATIFETTQLLEILQKNPLNSQTHQHLV